MPQNNPKGQNQHGAITEYPEDWPKILQGFRRRGLQQAEMLLELSLEHQIIMSKRRLQRQLTLHTQSTRNPKVDEETVAERLVEMLHDDPQRSFGARTLKEKLAKEDLHVTREYITEFLKVLEPQVVASRCPGAQKVHKRGLHSIGPDEEWSVDGHDKLVNSMGVGVWGVVDKFSRYILDHYAVPNNRLADVTLALYLLTIKKAGGIPICLVADMGSETGKIHALQDTLRMRYAPGISIEEIPAARHTKSVYNITVERQWQPLYRKCLSNVLAFWRAHDGQYLEGNWLHQQVSKFLWAKIIQLQLNQHVQEHNDHKIRLQKQSNLPSGGSADQFYRYPNQWDGVHCLIPVPVDEVDLLIARYVPDDLFVFCDTQVHHTATASLEMVEIPPLTPKNGWNIFSIIIPVIEDLLSLNAE